MNSIENKSKKELLREIATLREQLQNYQHAKESQNDSEIRFRELADLLPLVVFETNITGELTFINKQAIANFGYSYKEFNKGFSIAEIIFTIDQKDLEENKFLLDIKQPISGLECLAKRKNGTTFPTLVYATPIIINNKNCGLRGVIVDITERKQTEEALRESENNLREAQHIAHLGSWSLDLKTNLISASEEMLNIYKYPTEQLDNLSIDSWLQFLHPDDKDRVFKALENTMLKGVPYELEFRILRTDGEMRFVYARGERIENSSGKPYMLMGIGLDITDRKLAEQSMQASETFLDSIIENIPHMIFVKDAKELRFVRLNKAGEELLGYSKEELIGKNDYDFFIKAQADSFTAYDRAVLKTGNMTDILEENIQTRHKGERILHTKKIPITNEQGIPQYLLGISEDITEYKWAENALKESEERLSTFMNSATDAFTIWDSDLNLIELNQTATSYLPSGIKKEDVLGKNITMLVPDSISSGRYKKHLQVLKTGKPTVFEEVTLHPRYGKRILNARVFRVGDGLGIMTTDITHRVQVEKELRKNKERLVFAQRIAKIGDFTWDIDSGEVTWSDAIYELLKYKKSDKIDYSKVNTEIHHPDDLERITKWLNDSLTSGKRKLTPNEYRLIRKDAKIIYVRTMGVIERVKGKAVRMFATVQDITERKQVELALKERDAFLTSVVENIPNMIFVKDAKELRFVRLNKAGEKLLGYSSGRMMGKNDYDFFPKEEADYFTKKDREVLKSGKLVVIQKETIKTRYQGDRILFTKKIPLTDSKGKSQYLLGISEDITDRIKADEQIKKSLKEKEILLKEIYHRVKNNLAVVSGLINMQSAYIKDKEAIAALQDTRDRIFSYPLKKQWRIKSQYPIACACFSKTSCANEGNS